MTIPDPATLPTTDWCDDRRPAPVLTPVHSGIHLGTDADGRPVALPAPGATGIRIAALGESLFGRIIALRLLGIGARVTAVTRVPDQWRGIHGTAGDRLRFAADPDGWPPEIPTPPTAATGPQALVTDRRQAPPAALAHGAWRIVLHVTRTAPRHAAFWHRPDALVALDAAHAPQVARVLGAEAAAHTSRLAPGEIAVFRAGAAETLRLDLSPLETSSVLTLFTP